MLHVPVVSTAPGRQEHPDRHAARRYPQAHAWGTSRRAGGGCAAEPFHSGQAAKSQTGDARADLRGTLGERPNSDSQEAHETMNKTKQHEG